MTIAKTIKLAEDHARNGNVPGACRILDSAIRVAGTHKAKWTLDIAKTRILDAAVDATVARSLAKRVAA
jgi:hypothetical protein